MRRLSWIRLRLARSVPENAWHEPREAYATRLKGVVRDINEELDVDGLCRRLPTRVAALVATKGDRISQ